MKSNTAVLFFSLSPVEQAMRKRLISRNDFQTDVSIAAVLCDHSQQQIINSGLQWFSFDETVQTGHTFGEKLTNAFTELFDRGYEHVIAVGNDTPGLKSDHLKCAADTLDSEDIDIILGPSTDGGTWLIGFCHEAFDPEKFQSLPWNSSSLLSVLLDAYGKDYAIRLLEQLDDLDTPDKLTTFLRIRCNTADIYQLQHLILSLICSVNRYLLLQHNASAECKADLLFLLRAPPSLSDQRPLF